MKNFSFEKWISEGMPKVYTMNIENIPNDTEVEIRVRAFSDGRIDAILFNQDGYVYITSENNLYMKEIKDVD